MVQLELSMKMKQRDAKETVKDKILTIFQNNDFLTLADIRDRFERTEKGINSLDRYIRFLRAEGHEIIKRHKSDNTWEYKLLK